MIDLTDGKRAPGRLIHEMGWQRADLLQAMLRLAAAIAAIVLIIVIVGG